MFGGYFIVAYVEFAGVWQFTFGYIISLTLDTANFVITQTMIFSKMKPESRGLVQSITIIIVLIGVFIMLQTMAFLQGQHGNDYGAGGKAIFWFIYLITFVYWVLLSIYTFGDAIRNCYQSFRANR